MSEDRLGNGDVAVIEDLHMHTSLDIDFTFLSFISPNSTRNIQRRDCGDQRTWSRRIIARDGA